MFDSSCFDKNHIIRTAGNGFIELGALASQVKPGGHLGSNLLMLAIEYINDYEPHPDKHILNWEVGVKLMEGNYNHSIVKRAFRSDKDFKLTRKDFVSPDNLLYVEHFFLPDSLWQLSLCVFLSCYIYAGNLLYVVLELCMIQFWQLYIVYLLCSIYAGNLLHPELVFFF